MITARYAVVAVRFLLSILAVTLGSLKLFLATEAAPLLGVPASAAANLNIPSNTNPVFANVVIAIGTLLALALAVLTARDFIRQYRLVGHLAPYSSPIEILLTTFLACFTSYYFVIAVLADARWYFAGTITLILIIISLYEGRQYAEFGESKKD